jgi:hypothetical protein
MLKDANRTSRCGLITQYKADFNQPRYTSSHQSIAKQAMDLLVR